MGGRIHREFHDLCRFHLGSAPGSTLLSIGQRFVWHGVGYAVSRIAVTRADSGQQVFNASEIFGSAVAAGASTYSYHPRDERTLRNAASVWGTQIGLDTFTLNVKEFWPDIRRKFSQKKQHDNVSP